MSKSSDLLKVVNYINKDPALADLFRLNLHSMHIEFAVKPPWNALDDFMTDGEFSMFEFYLASVHDLQPIQGTLWTAITVVARKNTYHPIKQYLEKLTWDGTPRLDTWLQKYTGADDNIYVRAVGRKVLTAAVKRLYEPGCKFDYMMILESQQGARKTQLLEVLGGDYYISIELGDRNKDTVDAMRRGWIIEIADLAGMRKHEIESLKAFFTRRVDWVRMAYGRVTQPYHRQSVLIGTHNPSGDNDYFTDDTGNRRFWPVDCVNIDIEGFSKVKDQLWAEAKVLYKQGEKVWLEGAEEKFANDLQDRRLSGDPWFNDIKDYMDKRNDKFTTVDILNGVLHMAKDRIELRHQQRVGRIVKKIGGWTKKQETTGEKFYEKNQNGSSKPKNAERIEEEDAPRIEGFTDWGE